MKISKEIKKQSLPWQEIDGILYCPHCNSDLQKMYDNNELKAIGDTGIITYKDPCFCESSSETTVYWKCPKCSKPIEEFISWDN